MTRVLLVGSNAALSEGLAAAGATVLRAADAVAATERLSGGVVDCVVVVEPSPFADAEGLERRLREAGHVAPVVSIDDDGDATVERVLAAATDHQFESARDRRRALRELVADLRASLAAAGGSIDVEETVTDRLVESGLYHAAWLGRWDAEDGAVVPVAATGLEPGALGSVSPGPSAPVAGRVAVDWTPVSDGTGPDATAAVPLVAAEPRGILQVHADRPDGLGEAEVSLLAELGEAIAAAIAEAEEDEATAGPSDDLQVLGDTLAHELGNQLDAARVQLELARERDDEDHFERVEEALSRMEGLAADARALAGEEVRTETLQLSTAAGRAWDSVETTDATLDVVDGEVVADPDLLGLLLENCFRNAVQHAGPDVMVTVGPTEDGGFYLADDGPGIPPEEREAIFEWGYSTRSSSGSGLAIVDLVAARHGWSVEIGESEDGGARFAFG